MQNFYVDCYCSDTDMDAFVWGWFFVYPLQRGQNLLLGGHTIHIQFCEYLELWLQILLDILFMDEM